MAKVKKAQSGADLKPRQYKRLGRIAESNPNRADKVADRMKTRASREQRGRDIAQPVYEKADAKVKDWALDMLSRKEMQSNKVESAVKRPPAKFNIPKIKKSKNGSSFPDLNKDGKITKADILKGRGVIAQGGAAIKIKKTQAGNTNTQATNSSSLRGYRSSKVLERDVLPNAKPESSRLTKKDTLPASKPGASKKTLMKKGGKIKKAQAGLTASNKRVGPIDPKGAWTKVQEMTIAGKKTPVSLKKDKQLGATKMKMGGALKPVDKAKNPGLSKLPTLVRNKMGYQKNGGKVKKK